MGNIFLRRSVLRAMAASTLLASACLAPQIAHATDPTNLSPVTVTAKYFPPPIFDGWAGSVLDSGWSGDTGQSNPGDYQTVDVSQPSRRDSAERTKCEAKGAPIVFPTGNEIDQENDFSSQGEMGLTLNRDYNFNWDGVGIFGHHWLSSFDYKLLLTTTDPNSSCYAIPGTSPHCDATNQVIWAQRPDGRKVKFNYAGGSPKKWTEDRTPTLGSIVLNADGSYILNTDEHTVETYDPSGFPLKVLNKQGVGWTFAWSATHLLTKVTHNSGRAVGFGWTGTQLTSVTDPAGHIFRYTYIDYYMSSIGVARNLLSRVVLPGVADPSAAGGTPVTTIDYTYNTGPFSDALTGVSFNGSRYSWIGYDDTTGMAISTSYADGIEKYTFGYSNDGNDKSWTTIVNPLGKQTKYAYEKGNQVSITGVQSTHCPGNYQETTYDSNGNRDLVTDFRDNITDYDYSASGQLLKSTENVQGAGGERIRDFTWNPDNQMSRVVLEGFSQSDTAYTGNGRVASQSLTYLGGNGGAGRVMVTRYNYTTGSNGLVSKLVVSNPQPSDVTAYSYNSTGDLVSEIDGVGNAITYGNYNGLGLPGTIKDANGSVTSFTYDFQGRISQKSQVIGGVNKVTRIAYNALGKPTDLWTPDGRHIVYTYDAAYRLVSKSELEQSTPSPIFSNKSNTTTRQTAYGYDANSDITSVVNQRVVVSWVAGSSNTSNGISCPIPAIGDPSSATRSQISPPCDPPGPPQPVMKTTITLATSVYTDYDELGRPIAVRGNHGQVERMTYDDNGNLATKTDAAGRTTRYAYDNFNRLARVTDAAAGNTSMAYDLADHLSTVIDPRGLATRYYYDAFGLLWRQDSPDTGVTLQAFNSYGQKTITAPNDGTSIRYTYDAIGRLLSRTSQGRSQTWTYDTCTLGKGKLCGVQDSNSNEQFGYDQQGNLVTQRILTHGHDDWTSYGYDADGALNSVVYPSGTIAQYYTTFGNVNLVKVTVGGSATMVVQNTAYDAAGNPTSWNYGSGMSRTQTYDTDGRIASMQTLSGAATLQNYTYMYDDLNRLIKRSDLANTNRTMSYGYDVLGRLTNESSPLAGSAVGYAYDANGNRKTTTWIGITNVVIAPGSNQVLQDGATQFTYEPNGNRKTWMVGGTTANYTYDPFGRMASMSRDLAYSDWIANYPAGTTIYNVNPLGQRVYKSGPTGEYWFDYGPDGRLMADNITGKGWSDYIYFGGQPVALVRSGVVYYIHGDHLGRPEIVSNGSRQSVWTATNGTFGRSSFQSSIGTLNLGFPGQYYDAETGHWHNGFRDYDQNSGRYLESDPLGLEAGINTYAYVNNNSIQRVDPMGLDDTQCMYAPSACGMQSALPGGPPPRLPDYATFQLDAYVFSISATYTANGDIFLGKGTSRPYPNPLSGGVSISAGWMINPCSDGHPTREQLNNFLDGYSGGAGGYFGAGGSFSINPSGQGFNLGVGAGAGGFTANPAMVNSYQGNIFGDPQ